MARLLAAEQGFALAQRLEHVAVTDVRDDDLDSVLAHQLVEAEVRHHRHRDEVDAEVEREHGEDLVSVDRVAFRVHREHAVAVTVEGDPEVVPARRHRALEEGEIGCAAADVDVRAVRIRGDRRHLGTELLEGLRRDSRVRAVRAVDREPEPGQVAAEPLDDVLEVAVGGDADVVDRSLAVGRRSVEERLDLLLGGVAQLAAVGVEELDPVVLRRVVRGGDDRTEVEGEERDGRGRQDACDDGVPTRGCDALRERLLEVRPRAACVAPDEDAATSRPDSCRAA